jgi:anti-sigma regulatory factor (Ser/Thr protein kinase)
VEDRNDPRIIRSSLELTPAAVARARDFIPARVDALEDLLELKYSDGAAEALSEALSEAFLNGVRFAIAELNGHYNEVLAEHGIRVETSIEDSEADVEPGGAS